MTNQIANFPKQIVAKMVSYQFEQNENPKGVEVFQKNKECSVDGFRWNRTSEGAVFWHEVIINQNFEHFYTKHPKASEINISDRVKQYLGNTNRDADLYHPMILRAAAEAIVSQCEVLMHSNEIIYYSDYRTISEKITAGFRWAENKNTIGDVAREILDNKYFNTSNAWSK